jgi:hypothetical protein
MVIAEPVFNTFMQARYFFGEEAEGMASLK